jgi:hypothetical protein
MEGERASDLKIRKLLPFTRVRRTAYRPKGMKHHGPNFAFMKVLEDPQAQMKRQISA